MLQKFHLAVTKYLTQFSETNPKHSLTKQKFKGSFEIELRKTLFKN